MKVKNIKLFTEYERQFKRLFPGNNFVIISEHDGVRADFNVLDHGKLYDFAMLVKDTNKTDHLVNVYIWDHRISDFTFEESKTTGEMNVRNLISICRQMVYRLDMIKECAKAAKENLSNKEWLTEKNEDFNIFVKGGRLDAFCKKYNIPDDKKPDLEQVKNAFLMFTATGLVYQRYCGQKVTVDSYHLHHMIDDMWKNLLGQSVYENTIAVTAGYYLAMKFFGQDIDAKFDGVNFDIVMDEFHKDYIEMVGGNK